MRNGDISDSIYCCGAACAADLPLVEYERKLPKKGVPYNELPTEKATRRPDSWEVEVVSFPQMWSSTALGFGGIGGQAMTNAQTTIVSHFRDHAVYFGRRLAYVLEDPSEKFYEDMRSHRMAECADKSKYLRKAA